MLNQRYFKRFDSLGGAENFEFWRKLVSLPRDAGTTPRSVLILRPDSIGDFVIFSRQLEGYRNMFPRAKLDLLGVPEVCALAEATGLFEDTIAWDRYRYEKRGVYWREMLTRLSETPYDLVIYPCYSREANADEMAAVIPASERWAVKGDDCNLSREALRYNERLYSLVVDISPVPEHESARNAAILSAFGGIPKSWNQKQHPLFTEEDTAISAGLLEDLAPPYVAMVPGAQNSYKCWPRERFAEVLDAILDQTRATVLLGGSPQEESVANWLRAGCQAPERVRILTGRIGIRGFAAVISRAALLIGNDSGPAHIAGAMGIPAWIVMGGGHYGRFLPDPQAPSTRVFTSRRSCFGCNWRCKESEPFCITKAKLPVDSIIKCFGIS
ncbi:MAG: hypothetical protein DRH50_05030 [Deltaproteobacteria bacterium]|nr:MAG: hypothetical protein DRH50_05030 [Deltaproteobacteria bacterium]